MGGRLLVAGAGVAVLVLAGLAVAATRGPGGAKAGPTAAPRARTCSCW
jgi:hypothetical protein